MANEVKYEDFLGSAKYKVASSTIKVFEAKDLKDSVEFNVQGATITKLDAIDSLTAASAMTDGSIAPQTPSYQPQNEAGLAVSGTALESSAMGANVSNAISIQDKSVEFIKRSGMLSPDFYEVTNFTTETIKDGNKLLSTGAMSLANSSEKANGSIIFNSATDFKIGGGNIFFGSEGTIHETSAIKSSVHNNSTTQAKTHNVIADVKTENLKHKVKHIEGSDHTVAKNIQTTATVSDRKYGKSMSATASEDYKVAGNSISNYADNIAEIHSGNTIYQTAQSNLVSQAGDISITATSSTITPVGDNPTSADGSVGERLTQALANNSTGCINILAQGNLSSYGEKVVNTSTASTYNFSGEDIANYGNKIVSSALDILSGASKNNTVFGSKNASLQSKRNSIHVSNKKISVGKNISLKRILPNILDFLPKVVTIPPLPTMPGGISNASLENCIPDKFKPPKSEEDTSIGTTPKSSTTSPKSTDIPREKKTPIPTTKVQTRIPTSKSGGTEKGRTNEEILGDLQQQGNSIEGISGATNRSTTSIGEALKGSTTNGESNKSGPSSATASNTSSLSQDKPVGVGNAIIAANVVFAGGIDIFSPTTDSSSPTAFDSSPQESHNERFKVSCAQIADLMTDSFIVSVATKYNLDPSFLLTLDKYFEAFANLGTESLTQLKPPYKELADDKLKIIQEDLRLQSLLKEMVSNGSINLLIKCLEEVYSLVAIGGLFELTQSTITNVNSAITVVSNLSQETTNPLTVFNELTNIPLVSNIISSNSTLSNLVSLGKTISGDTSTNINQQIESLANQVITSQLDKVITKLNVKGLNKEGVDQLIDIFKQVNSGQALDQDTVDGLINQVTTVIGNDKINEAINIYKEVSPILKQISNGDIDSLLEGEGLDNILSFVLGPNNAGVLGKAKDIYTKGKSLYETISSIPSLINLMNDYEIPLLNQINVALNCLDLMNQVMGLIDSVSDLFNSKNKTDTIDVPASKVENNNTPIAIDVIDDIDFSKYAAIETLENLPRLIQIYNSIQDTPLQAFGNTVNISNTFINSIPNVDTPITNKTIDSINKDIDSTNFSNTSLVVENILLNVVNPSSQSVNFSQSQVLNNNNVISYTEVEEIKKLIINKENSNCYTIPKLNYLEASIKIKAIENGKLLFSLLNPKLLDLNLKQIYPGVGDVVQIRIESFINNKTGETLSIYREEDYFSPYVYSFTIIDYLKEDNIGLANLLFNYNRIYLTNNNKVVYEYDIQDVGGRLSPIISDSYLLL